MLCALAACGDSTPRTSGTLTGDDEIMPQTSEGHAGGPLELISEYRASEARTRDLARGTDLIGIICSDMDVDSLDVIRVLDPATGGVVFEEEAKWAMGVAISPDDRLVGIVQNGSAFGPDTVTVWEVESGETLLSVESPNAAGAIAFTPDNASVVTAGFDIQLTSLADGLTRSTSIDSPDDSLTNASSVAYVPSTDAVVAAGPYYYAVWRLSQERSEFHSPGSSPTGAVVHPTGRVVFEEKDRVSVWRVDTDTQEGSVVLGHSCISTTLDSTGLGLLVLGVTEDWGSSRATLASLEEDGGLPIALDIPGLDDTVRSDGTVLAATHVVWGPDSQVVIARDGDDSVRLERFSLSLPQR